MNSTQCRYLAIAVFFLSVTFSTQVAIGDDHHVAPHGPAADVSDGGGHNASFIPVDYPQPFGFSLTAAWLDPWPHSHFSRRGTPFVHLFTLEPAFLDRDLFFDYRFASAQDEEESELETELEWAFTRRIGLVVEAPLVQVNPEEGQTEQGLGDVAVAPRFLLADTERFLLSGNLELSLPTGSESRGLGGGEVALAPSLSTWADLGNWVTVSAQAGTEHGVESGDSELFYNVALTYSFMAPRLFRPGHSHATYYHFPPGLTSLIGEFTGRTVLAGEDDGTSTAELLLGVSYNLTEYWEVRAAYQFPLGEPEEIDYGYVFSLIYHF